MLSLNYHAFELISLQTNYLEYKNLKQAFSLKLIGRSARERRMLFNDAVSC